MVGGGGIQPGVGFGVGDWVGGAEKANFEGEGGAGESGGLGGGQVMGAVRVLRGWRGAPGPGADGRIEDGAMRLGPEKVGWGAWTGAQTGNELWLTPWGWTRKMRAPCGVGRMGFLPGER